MLSNEYNKAIFEAVVAAKVEVSEVFLPALSQFKDNGKFKTISPNDTEKKYYLGNCKRCGVAVKYAKDKSCVVCRFNQNSKRDYSDKPYRKTSMAEREQGIECYPKAYGIRHVDGGKNIYVGSTLNTLITRKADHMSAYKLTPDRKLYAYVAAHGGWDSFEFVTMYVSAVVVGQLNDDGSITLSEGTSDEEAQLEVDLVRLFESWYINDLDGLMNVSNLDGTVFEDKNKLTQKAHEQCQRLAALYAEIEVEGV